jgi:hypothetical protein
MRQHEVVNPSTIVREGSAPGFCFGKFIAGCVDVFDECVVVDCNEVVLSCWTKLSTLSYYFLRR